MKRPLEDNPWFICGIIPIVIGAVLSTTAHFIHKANLRSDTKQAAYEKEFLARPTRDMRNGFVKVNEMNCLPALKGYTKKQLSKLTDEDKWLAKGSTECGVTYTDVRLKKDGILGYYSHFSVFLWRNHEDDNDPGAPVHVKEINIENCQIALRNKPGQVKLVVIEGKCELMDKAL